jgi:hypothetical protein
MGENAPNLVTLVGNSQQKGKSFHEKKSRRPSLLCYQNKMQFFVCLRPSTPPSKQKEIEIWAKLGILAIGIQTNSLAGVQIFTKETSK